MLKNIIKAIILFLVLSLAFAVVKAYAEAPNLTYEDELSIWVEKLGICESRGNPDAINKHDGGSPSYGLHQWKLGSFWSYNQKLDVFPELTLDNLHSYVMDGDKQIKMTKEVIRQDYAWKNWYNCTKKIGLPPQL